MSNYENANGDFQERADGYKSEPPPPTLDEKVIVYKLRPAGEFPWLFVPADYVAKHLEETLHEGDENELWEITMVHMTRAEIDALPEFDGW